MKIIVLAGGKSNEREVSMTSGSKIANALIAKGHKVLLVDLLTGMPEHRNFDSAYKEYKTENYQYNVSETVPNFDEYSDIEIGKNVLEICGSADITFFALHGGIGENGKLQAIFDVYNIKYTGSGYQSSLLAMDKLISKELMRFHGIPTANWTVISDLEEMEEVCLPAVVKPTDSGSSIGISIVEDYDSLQQAIKEALKYSGSSKILVEDKIVGREFSVGVLGKQVLPAIELIPKAGFYDYQNKYQIGRTEEIVPANIDVYLAGQMKDLALRIHQVLGLSVCSRSDFLIDENNNIFLIEVNSLPGMTPTSLLPQEAAAVGIDFEDLCERVVSESLLKCE
ncbi:D-alanine--D-alanine ligase [Enterococcus hulanensis]|uniref:D-alanine--D-alanine ligase family protein n=1 Tax=Enterococcus hulanensis TaxID=2559929 RepID=UPI00288DA790|nr:D-alanine--D-alanine ligase [Enterococcus hulanensis]MDT2661975.1 D-alanine--D-alanine ligase [Enterococcus hulanensis]